MSEKAAILESELKILKILLLELNDAKDNLEAHSNKSTGKTASIHEMVTKID
jgi:hypothetical protein